MTRNVDSLYICPWSYDDPLCRSQSLAYIRELANDGRRFALITFEAGDIKDAGATPIHENIEWHPVRWSPGNSPARKIGGIVRLLAKGVRICLKNHPSLIHSRTSLPAFAAVCLAKAFRSKFLYDADSLLSEEYADTGHLARESLGFRFLRWSERWARDNADEIIVLTQTLREQYQTAFGVSKKQINVIPCCVDTSKFTFSVADRVKRRAELGVGDEPLLIYVGKVGSWYLVEQTFFFYEAFRKHSPNAKLLIVSPDPNEAFARIAANHGTGPERFFVRRSSYAAVSEWLSAADAGLAMIKQVPSKRGSSPVKFAEYLSCGLPVVTTDGIGDCSSVVEENRVGVVIERADDPQEIVEAASQLEELLAEGETLRTRCRQTAMQYFDLSAAGHRSYGSIYDRLLG